MNLIRAPAAYVAILLGAIYALFFLCLVFLAGLNRPPTNPRPGPETLGDCVEACAPWGVAVFELDRACYCQTNVGANE